MERLCHDLNLALEESNCGRQERRKLGLRRRTRSAGNLPSIVSVSLVEDGSSSSPPQAPLVTQPLSDSDDSHLQAHKPGMKSRHYCQISTFESDSFNENFSPTRPCARRKRKFKKITVECDGKRTPPIEVLGVNEPHALPALGLPGQAPVSLALRHRAKPERNAFCGKRKWSHRDKDVCEMRERSFSGGCSSKSAFFSKSDTRSKRHDVEKKRNLILQPGKIVLKTQNLEGKPSSTPSFPGSSSFNFVYKNSKTTPMLSKMTGYKVTTELPPFFNPTTSTGRGVDPKHRKFRMNRTYPCGLRNPLQFDDSNSGMDCAGNESSSLSSSDSDGVVTNDSDREGDDELTDWPGIEELKVFNKSLTFKTSKTNNSPLSLSNMPPPNKRLKKSMVKLGWYIGKNKFKKKRAKVESDHDEDAMMSDSKTVVEIDDVVKPGLLQRHASLVSFRDVKDAGISGENADRSFFRSFQAFEKSVADDAFPPREEQLQKTSSSDLNASDPCSLPDTEVREIRAGCRRIREERPGFLILSAANEQLARFLQDPRQTELRLASHDPGEREKLDCLARLYSLRLTPDDPVSLVLTKTSNTMQAIQVEHYYCAIPSEHKRRCYGDEPPAPLPGNPPALPGNPPALPGNPPGLPGPDDNFSRTLVDKSLLHPGDID